MTDVTVIGNINEPEFKFTPNGKPVLNFNLAENHSKKDQNGQWQDEGTTWRRVSIWERKAEALANELQKGDRVIVVGSERIREYEARDGSKGQSLELRARDIGKIPRLPDHQQGYGNQQGQYQQQGGYGAEHQPQGNWGANPNQDPWANNGGGSAPF